MAIANHTAAGSLAGAIWQVELGLLRLFHMELRASLSIEQHEDLAVLTVPESLAVLTQAKHSFKGRALTPASVALWRTLRIWTDHARKESGSLPRFELVTTRRIDETLSILTSDANRNEVLTEELVTLLDAIACRRKNNALRQAYSSWLSVTDAIRFQILQRATIIGGQSKLSGISAAVTSELLKVGVAPSSLLDARRILETWYRDLVRERLTPAGCAIYHDEFLGTLREVHRLASAYVLPVLHAADDIPEMIVEAEAQKVYQRQLAFIRASTEEKLLAYEYFTRARAERHDWLAKSLVAMGDLEVHEAELINLWRSLRAQTFRDTVSPRKTVELSRRLLDDCVKMASIVRGQAAPHHVHVGTLHIVADGPTVPRIGWHRDYLDLLTGLWSK